MAAKKTAKKKQTKSEQATRNKITPTKKTAKKLAIKGQLPTKQSSHEEVTAKAVGKKSRRTRQRSQAEETVTFVPVSAGRVGGQSGDLQGLSSVEGADSESVVELLEEGNAFEAAAVAGVESAGNADQREVHTREVPTDDVPDEYLDRG